jgi:hypothetical protein
MLKTWILAVLIGFAAILNTPQVQAQSDGEDAYDPFADYSEFDEASDEESDINFFRHGRFFTIGFAGGYRMFTQNMAKIYSPNISYGLYMSYFFDLRLALQFGFLTGDHGFGFKSGIEKYEGNVSFTFVNIDLKYFLSTQNVSRGLADLNPYFFGGISQTYRTISLPGDGTQGRDSTMGLNLGAGIEIPIVRKKSYLGFQGTYRNFNFKDENQSIVMPSGVDSGFKPAGDSIDLLGIIGMSF